MPRKFHVLGNSYCEIIRPFHNSSFSKTLLFLTESPTALGPCFLYSFFGPFNLQLQMSDGLVFSLLTSILCASVVLFLTIGDLIVTILAIIVISGSILSTTAAITLMGWELGILESISITLSVG